MEMWFLITLISAVFLALTNLFDKYVLSNIVERSEIFIFFVFLVNVFVFIFMNIFISIPIFSIKELILALFAGIFFSVMILLFFRATSIEEVSKTVPFFNFSPLFVAIFSFIFLGELLNFYQYFGMIFVIIGAYILSKKEGTKLSFGKPFILMFFSVISLSFYSILVDYLLNIYDYWTVFLYTRIGVILGFTPIIYLQRKSILNFFRESNIKNISLPFINESLSLISPLLTVVAISLGPVSLVNTVLLTRSLFVLIFSAIISVFSYNILKEKFDKKDFIKKTISIFFMVIGASIIVLND